MGENCGEPLEDAEALLFSGTAEVDIWFTSDEMLCRLFVAGGKVIVTSEDAWKFFDDWWPVLTYCYRIRPILIGNRSVSEAEHGVLIAL